MATKSSDETTVNGTGTPLANGKVYKLLAMRPGAGEESYTKNSEVQAYMVNNIWTDHLKEALELVSLPTSGPVVVADLGCSSGPNTINIISLIVETLRARCTSSSPDFFAYFNDLPSTDFNNLFQLLTVDSKNRMKFFAAGVPGSFFNRIFPRKSVNVMVSFNCIHFVSKIPDVVLDKNSPAYNRGKFSAHNSTPEVIAAFKEQASIDFKQFLDNRAAELQSGGLLLLGFGGRTTDKLFEDPVMEACWESLDDVWSELISEGILTDEQRDTFNYPLYQRTVEEITEALESYKSVFHVHKIEFPGLVTDYVDVFQTTDPVELTKKFAGIFRASVHSLTENHIGKEATAVFWERYPTMIRKNAIPLVLQPAPEVRNVKSNPVVVLLRK